MDRKYKPLRPAVSSTTPSSDADSPDRKGSRNESSQSSIRKKRVQVKIACDACRVKKSACDGQRPTCAACERRGSTCTFGRRTADASESSSSQIPLLTEPNQQDDATELLNLLISAPSTTASGLLQEIRIHGDFSAALEQIKRGRDISFDEFERLQPLNPPDQKAVEFELMCRQPIAYPAVVALDLDLDPTITSSRKRAWSLSAEDTTSLPQNEYPFSKDSRLGIVDIAVWTKVPVRNEVAVRALSRYLDVDHPILGLFDADLFLDDLSTYSTRFCTEFMINALSSWAFLSSPDHAYETCEAFLSEAVGFWKRGEETDSLPTLAALQFVSLTAMHLGRGDQSVEYLRQAVQMGRRMGFFNVAAPEATGPSELRAACQGAWGLFSYASMHGFHCQRNELGTLPPPALPLPHCSAWLLALKQDPALEDGHNCVSFPYFAQLWVIFHEIGSRYYSVDQSTESLNRREHFATSVLERLLRWVEQLPLPLVRGNRVTHHGIILHILFHSAVLFCLRPLVSAANDASLIPNSHSSCTAQEISKASVNQLRRLVIIYQSQFASKTQSILWHTGCLYLANAAMPSAAGQQAQVSDLHLALAGYRALYPRYPVTLAMFKGLLAIAVARRLVPPQEAYTMLQQIRKKQLQVASPSPLTADTSGTCIIIDLDLALTDQESARIDRVAQRFDDMVMFDQFTDNRVDADGGVAIQ